MKKPLTNPELAPVSREQRARLAQLVEFDILISETTGETKPAFSDAEKTQINGVISALTNASDAYELITKLGGKIAQRSPDRVHAQPVATAYKSVRADVVIPERLDSQAHRKDLFD